MLLGHTTVCAVELKPKHRACLLQRQREGNLPRFPIWDDAKTFDGKPWRGVAEIICSGFPCKPFSRLGEIHGSETYNGWPDTLRIFDEANAKLLFLENVPNMLRRYWGTILADMAGMGLDVRWGVFSCSHIDQTTPIEGERLFALAAPNGRRQQKLQLGMAECAQDRRKWEADKLGESNSGAWSSRIPEPSIQRMADGLAEYVGELEAIGNGQIPTMAALAFKTLSKGWI